MLVEIKYLEQRDGDALELVCLIMEVRSAVQNCDRHRELE